MDIDIIATYNTRPTAADLAPYRRQLRTCLRLAGAAAATLNALYERDKAANATKRYDRYSSYSTPQDTKAASDAFDQLHRQAFAAACVLFAAGDLTAEQLAQVLNPLCPP